MNMQQKIKLPLLSLLGSLIFMIGLFSLTNPINNIVLVVFFFGALYFFLFNSLKMFLALQPTVFDQKKTNSRSVWTSSILVIFIMMRSAHALNIVELALVIIFFIGLWFYLNRR
jgi:hypothetical protein